MLTSSAAHLAAHRAVTTLASAAFSSHWLLYFGCMLVVIKEASERNGYHFLDNVLFIYVFKLAHDIVHVRCNLVFINVSFHDVVHHLIELFLADLLGFRQFSVDKVLANLLFYLSDFPLFLDMYDADRSSFLARTPCSAASVRITFDVIGQSVVDDMSQIVHVKPTGSDVSSYKQLHRMLAKLLHGEITLLLTQVAMQCFGVITVFNKLVGNLLSLYLCATEDNGKDTRMKVNDALQCQIFVLGMYEIVDVVHVFCALITASYDDFLIVVKIAFGHFLHLTAHRCREK